MAKGEQQELTPDAEARIRSVVRSLQEDRVERGIPLNVPMRCDSCGQEKSAAGSSVYGAYKFCNDCLLDFTVDLASGRTGNVVDFMTRHTDGDGSGPAEFADHRERQNVQYGGRLGRDSFRPSTEPTS